MPASVKCYAMYVIWLKIILLERSQNLVKTLSFYLSTFTRRRTEHGSNENSQHFVNFRDAYILTNIVRKLALHSVLNIKTLSDNPTKWSNTLKQFVGKWQTNCLNMFDHFVRLVLKGLTFRTRIIWKNEQLRKFSRLRKLSKPVLKN